MHKLVFEVLEDGTEVSYIHNGQVAIQACKVVSLASWSKIYVLIDLFFFRWQKLAFGYKKGSGFICKCHDQEVLLLSVESNIVGGVVVFSTDIWLSCIMCRSVPRSLKPMLAVHPVVNRKCLLFLVKFVILHLQNGNLKSFLVSHFFKQ